MTARPFISFMTDFGVGASAPAVCRGVMLGIAPDARLVETILDFGRTWDEGAPLLVHCWAGISRSTATAFIIACERNPGADELAIAMAMRRASVHAFPNRRIVALADDILDRRGRLLDAVAAMGGNGFVPEGAPFELAARH